jgi:hypothetical protein
MKVENVQRTNYPPPAHDLAQHTEPGRNNTRFIRLRSHFASGISLLIILGFISGCRTARTSSELGVVSPNIDPRLSSAVQDRQRVPEEDFLLNEDIVSRVSTRCKGKPKTEVVTRYGEWVGYTDCDIRINDDYMPVQRISLLVNSDSKRAEGYSAMIYGDEKHRNHLKNIYGEGRVSHSADTCSRFGYKTLPILQVVASKHCDALQYNLI